MELPGCSVAIKCADDLRIERCLDSIDDSAVSVHAVITPSERIEDFLRERDIRYVTTEYGNLAKSAELAVLEAEHDNVIIMDSDAYFEPGAVRLLRTALVTAPVAKPRLEFLDDGSWISKLIADSRRRYNATPNHATTPGLGLRRQEVIESCGRSFNPSVRWAEDTDLNYRIQRARLDIANVTDAVVVHDAVSLRHELRCAFQFGVGKRLSVENTSGRPSKEELGLVLSSLVKMGNVRKAIDFIGHSGLDAALLQSVWRVLYLTGYHAQKRTGRWSLENAG